MAGGTAHGSYATWKARVRHWLPTGRTLPDANWRRRHAGILIILAAHAVVLGAYAATITPLHGLFEGGVLLAFALAASVSRLPRRVRSSIAAAGLMSASAVLTHVSGGYIEAHFHFFVMIGVIALYEDWTPFLLGIVYVAVHHGLVGTIDPSSVYNHPDAIADPWRWALIHATFILALSAAVIVTWRVTETERTNALRSAQRQRAITDTALDAIVTIDASGRITDYNPAAERIFGYARTEALGREMAELIIPPDHREAHRAGLRRIAATGQGRALGRRLHLPAMRKDGSTFPAELAIVAVGEGEDRHYTGYLRDLTEQHQAKAELDATRLQLAKSEKMTAVGQLVGGVAHEIRTPLTYLSNNLYMINRRLERIQSRAPADIHPDIEHIPHQIRDALEAAQRIDRLVEDLRRYSKLKPGTVLVGSLHAPVEDAVALFAATHRASLHISKGIEKTTPVRMDPVQIQQIVLNLLQNASEAMPNGGTIRVTTGDENGCAFLRVQDTGPGILREIVDRVFDPFFTTKADGTGLGLSIVKRLADAHEATIHIANAALGTSIGLSFPASKATEIHVEAAQAVAAAPKGK